jgi:hypothetical protein
LPPGFAAARIPRPARGPTVNDGVKLLFGPYKATPFRRGDRAFCLLRDCDVVTTNWSPAASPGRGAVPSTATGAAGRVW